MLMTRQDAGERKFENVIDWEKWLSGFLEWISLLSKSSKVTLVPDRLGWLAKLQAFKNTDAYSRAKYGRLFMHAHAAALKWMELFHTDCALLLTLTEGSSGRSRKRHGAPNTPKSKKRLVRKNMPICFSRLDRDRGDCEHANCRFKHECPCCGDNHPASQCQRWDASKAKRAAEQAKKRRN